MMKKEQNNYEYLSDMNKWNTNRRALKFEFIRSKIRHLASDSGFTMGQYMMVAIYNTVIFWPQNSKQEIITKNYALSKLKFII